ncbi:3',5'-cyclic AMP phosphodiesterase CpdA [Nannocystis exedens]|uniref:3',5'-cyclic AMP phosphodiesterase CpdA n=1 Tax=Nannocystis exedens TaxID=54 RepID=A0A1I2A0J4_9BACT|nr:phosphodiesterase [Nannocystis exedens]PCC75259.1 metallophosphatase [Nannocystis exedens]SFE36260.1 3',5'-cyclic AMP phosphodiesterase CpdA [Nannocystis exedens]
MLIAQLSDTHVSTPEGPEDVVLHTSEHLARAVAHLNRLQARPDLVVITGDLVDRGEVGEYERLRELLAPLRMPVYLLPGNHDHRDNLRRVFADHSYLPRAGFLQYTVDDGPVRLVALDTHIPGEPGGRLCGERLAWLDARLAEQPQRPTLVAMHHPPFASGLALMDAFGLDGSDGLAAVLRRHAQVERVVCGHLHRPIVRRFAGTVACTCPSTRHQLALDLPPAHRLALAMEPPACMLHLWLGDAGGLVTHVSLIHDKYPPLVVHDGQGWVRNPQVPANFHPA